MRVIKFLAIATSGDQDNRNPLKEWHLDWSYTRAASYNLIELPSHKKVNRKFLTIITILFLLTIFEKALAQESTRNWTHFRGSNLNGLAACNSFLAGDYIEAEIVLFIVPEIANHYYGPNQNFTRALSEKTNTWELVYREAIGNDLDIDITTGTLINNYPIKIEADNSIARFSVTGGIGYVPLTISNVGSYRNPELYRKVDSKWEKVDQSVYGNDFWQTEYNSSRGNWDITYNINLDSPGDATNRGI